jgi:hypothetical protein
VEQERLTILEQLSSTLAFSGFPVSRSLVFCLIIHRSLFVITSFFILAITLSVL